MTARRCDVSAVLPVYNDRAALETAIPISIEALSAISDDFELIVAEDGSSDGSQDLVMEWAGKDERIRLLHSDERLGRGNALNRAFRQACGAIVCYYDVDLATDMRHLPQLVNAVRGGCDVATGSRLMEDSDAERTPERAIASGGYNFLVRMMLGSRLQDHQCGFKAFCRERLLALLPEVDAGHWFWDTEVLVRAQARGFRVCEFPVRWRPGKSTTVRPRDVILMGTDVIRLWWRLL
ncbi:MAG: glycosyltransferase [Methanomicrobiaceae archaeon]|nr:glycosyltransferase [Methanomicrobiaceae archaeon]